MTPREAPGEEPSARYPVEELAEAFLERYRRGERPSLSEFIAHAPEHAAEIRELFPALVVLEQADPAVSAKAHQACHLERLGDYRLIREVGRGGMGIVYEAEQEALGRHVALKILPISIGSDSQCLERFLREARSAARLHHTNIVPVFDIGERDGIHYYAMQFIQGQGLDEVIVELRRMRQQREVRKADDPNDKPAPSVLTDLAEGLATRRFGTESVGAAPPDSSFSHAKKSESGKPSVLSDQSDFSTKSDFQFYRSVARIGLQVAEALAYAHSQRVLHRDIKPSNLLLDAAGCVWVTDFGLAKEEGDDLTRPGDVVGTLRYMAPERLNGVSDFRSDVYGLGVTLYELLTLRPAFQESDRAHLAEKIARQEPAAPRKLNPQVPRDLETIVLKAIAKEPARRYATAQEMADDLRRFLMDRPIRARRTSRWEHVWRWCRRNPGWAATLAIVLGLLLVMAIGGSVMNVHLKQALVNLQAADNEKTDQLWQAHVERARALRSSGRVGQRFETLKAIRAAARIKMTPTLRDEAVAALALPDIEVAREWDGFPEGSVNLVHDAKFERYARIDKQGQITICRLGDNGEEVVWRLPIHGHPLYFGMFMSPDGQFLVYGHGAPAPGRAEGVRIWNLVGPSPTVYWDEPAGMHQQACSFHADGQRLAIGHANGTISIYDLRVNGPPRVLNIGQAANSLAFHPIDGLLAAACGTSIRLIDVNSGKELPALRNAKIDSWMHGLAWHPEGRLLAATSEDKKIHVWDTQAAAEVMPPLEGHAGSGINMAFNHQGDRLLSSSWDRQTYLWDPVTGRLLLIMPEAYGSHFNADDTLIGLGRKGTKLQIMRLADGRELRFVRRPAGVISSDLHNPLLDDTGRILAASSRNGLIFFEFATGRELASLQTEENASPYPRTFDAGSGWMTSGSSGALLWPMRPDPSRPRVVSIGPPQFLAATADAGSDASSDGRVRAVPQRTQTLLLDRDRPGKQVVLGPQFEVRNCAVSPDGHWVAAFSWWPDAASKSARVWDTQTGDSIDLPVESSSFGRFSPDGRWLAVNTADHGCQLWETNGWRPGKRFPNGGFCWSPKGQYFLIGDELATIRCVDPETAKEVFRLTGPEGTWYAPGCFTPDGATLIAATSDYSAIHVWDLRLIRMHLRELGMDWEIPEFSLDSKGKDRATPIAIDLEPGILRPRHFKSDRDAVVAFSLALALQPFNPEAYLHRGQAHARLNERDLALHDYDMFLKLSSTSDRRRTEIHFRRANNYVALKDTPRALAALAETSNTSPHLMPWPTQYARLCNTVVWELVKFPREAPLPEATLEVARKALDLEPSNAFYRNTLGVALYRMGRHEDALRCLETNLTKSDRFAAFDLYFLAMSHQRLSQTDKARSYLDRANAAAKTSGLSVDQIAELSSIRIEAEALIAR
jgi:serine/threonine protein kinase/WD40 repeat protein